MQKSRDRCFFCGRTGHLEEHHLLSGTSNRDNSEDYGLKVYICNNCHFLHSKGIVKINDVEIKESDIKAFAQRKWEETYGSREEFIKIFGKSWILED